MEVSKNCYLSEHVTEKLLFFKMLLVFVADTVGLECFWRKHIKIAHCFNDWALMTFQSLEFISHDEC